jgi:CBS domain containing-hemolysin-like protein
MENKKEDKNSKTHSNVKWFIQIFITTFMLSIIFSYISTNGVANLSLFPAILILLLVIFIGILFDVIGVAVTFANEEEFHAKATKKVEGSKSSIKLIKNASKVANICADVIGDICGVLSGAVSALIAVKISQEFGLNFNLQFLLSALVSALTVGGKAIGKEIANNYSTPIVHAVGIVLNKFKKENKHIR